MVLEKIQELCSQNNITVAGLERALQFGNGSIRKWENSYPGSDKLSKVADYFNISVDELLNRPLFKLSDEAFNIAKMYDGLSIEKQELIKYYMNVIKSK